MPEDLKPYTFPEAGAWRGIDLDIARELYARLDIEPRFVPMPWAQQLRLAERGILDAVLTVYCNEDSSHLLIPDVPLYTVGISLFSSTDKASSIAGEMPEPGSSVGIVRDNYFIKLLEDRNKLEISLARSTPLLLEQLVAGRVDYVLEETLPFLSYARDRGHSGNVQERRILEQTEVCLAFSKSNQQDFGEEFIEKVETILVNMKASGEIDAIISRYIN